MKTPCAFHHGFIITQFCKSSACLLPLCPQCIQIHKQQHQSSDPMNLTSIQTIVTQIRNSITSQFKCVDTVIMETISKYRQSDEQHKRLFQQILHHKDIVLNTIQSIYENIFIQLDQNAKRRQMWIREFNQSVLQLKEELTSLINSLIGEKYLRTVIMWGRIKPNQVIDQIAKKAEKKWLVPSFSGTTQDNLINYITNNTNLKVLQIEGDSGIKKVLQLIRILRYGQQESNSPNSSQKSLQSSQKTAQQKTQSQHLHLQKQPPINSAQNNLPIQLPPVPPKFPVLTSPRAATNLPNPLYFNSPTRKNSTKKIEVLSSLQFYKSTSQVIDNIK